MKTIFFAGKYLEPLDANASLALKIIDSYEKIEGECLIIFIDYDIKETIEQKINGKTVFRVPASSRFADFKSHYNRRVREGSLSLKQYILRYPFHALFNFIFSDGNHLSFNELTDFIRQKIEDKDADSLVSFVWPFYPTQALFSKINNISKVYYQLDPWGKHELLSPRFKNRRILQEVRTMSVSRHVFTTYPLYQQYKEDSRYTDVLSKTTPVNFPCFNSRTKETASNNEPYTILFLGTIRDAYRDPTQVIDFIMSANEKTRIIMIGNILSKACDHAKERYKDRITILPSISNVEADKLLNTSVFLLNINNTIKNQSPSKLIDYISTGNPIINCIKHEHDDSLRVLENYEMAFHFYENKGNSTDELNHFLDRYLNKKADKTGLSALYSQYTPDYIAQKIYSVFKNDQ